MALDFAKAGDDKTRAKEEKEERIASSESVDDLAPKQVDAVRVFSAERREAAWQRIYKDNGLATADEKRKRGCRYAYYVYALKNGTSSEGGWNGTARMYDGTVIHAKYARLACPDELRRFFRSTAYESYPFLSTSQAIREDPDVIAMAQEREVPVRLAYAMADFLDTCVKMSDEEKRINSAQKTFSVERARRARSGKAVEDLRHESDVRKLDAQGPEVGRAIDF